MSLLGTTFSSLEIERTGNTVIYSDKFEFPFLKLFFCHTFSSFTIFIFLDEERCL